MQSFGFYIDRSQEMATFELYRRSTIGMCLTETLDEMVQSGTLSPELAIQVLVQFDKVYTGTIACLSLAATSSSIYVLSVLLIMILIMLFSLLLVFV